MDLLALARTHSFLAAATVAALGGWLSDRAGFPSRGNLLAMGAAALVVAGANTFNDCVDVDADAVSMPGRPLPAGRISRRAAQGFAATLFAAAAIVGAVMGAGEVIVVLAAIAIAVGYSLRLKRIPVVGNACVGVMAAVPCMFGAVSAGSVPSKLAIAALAISSFMFAFETLKTVRDRDGDELVGARTTAVALGDVVAFRLVRYALFVSLATLLFGLPAARLPAAYLTLFIAGTTPLVIGGVLARSDEALTEEMGRALLLLRLAWLPSIGALFCL